MAYFYPYFPAIYPHPGPFFTISGIFLLYILAQQICLRVYYVSGSEEIKMSEETVPTVKPREEGNHINKKL